MNLVPCGDLTEFVLGDDVRLDASGYKRIVAARRGLAEERMRSGVWRFAELLPSVPPSAVVTLGENNVPLYDGQRGRGHAGVDRLAYLHLGMNPTGSFKDGGMTVAVSAARASGATAVACASTGNTAGSMAAYAARAGLDARIVVPRGRVSRAKLAQVMEYGGRVTEVDGSFDDAFAFLKHSTDDGAVVMNSVNPFRIEGQKCAAFVMLEQRDWSPPDWVVVPGGNLGNASAIGKGLREAHALGLVARVPRLAIARAVLGVRTEATAIAVGAPSSRYKALREVELGGGCMVAVRDDEIAEAKALIGREGIGCEPASAAALAAARTLRLQGTIAPDADVVCVLTGHVLKDVDYIERHRAARDAEEYATSVCAV